MRFVNNLKKLNISIFLTKTNLYFFRKFIVIIMCLSVRNTKKINQYLSHVYIVSIAQYLSQLIRVGAVVTLFTATE